MCKSKSRFENARARGSPSHFFFTPLHKFVGMNHSRNLATRILAHLSWKLQLAFSGRLFSVVCPFVCKLFKLSSSSQEPLGQFQWNLTQIILWWRGFKFLQMKGPALFQGEMITKKRWRKSNLIFLDNEVSSSLNERPRLFPPRKDNNEITNIHWRN